MQHDTTFDVEVTRVFNAPVDRVWRAWSESSELKKWWGPKGFTCPLAEVDFREGGKTLICMRAPKEFGGMDMYSTWSYTKIVPNERIEYTFNFSDKDGHKLQPTDMGLPAEVPTDGHHIVTFKAVDGDKTEMTVIEKGYGSAEARDTSQSGLDECLDKMAELGGK